MYRSFPVWIFLSIFYAAVNFTANYCKHLISVRCHHRREFSNGPEIIISLLAKAYQLRFLYLPHSQFHQPCERLQPWVSADHRSNIGGNVLKCSDKLVILTKFLANKHGGTCAGYHTLDQWEHMGEFLWLCRQSETDKYKLPFGKKY